MRTWVNILHLHQPPHQDEAILRKVTDESYRLIIRLLKTYSRLKIGLNISGSLLELLEKHAFFDVIEDFQNLAHEGKVELTGTAMYHPILPLLPPREATRQIGLFERYFSKTFKNLPLPKGFFLPEMAYSTAIGKTLSKRDYTYVILDENHSPSPVNTNTRYKIEGTRLSVLFRNRKISKSFPPEAVYKKDVWKEGAPLITAHDGELYGHWHRDDKGFYERVFTDPDIVFLTPSEYLSTLTEEVKLSPREISWETEPEDFSRAPYPLWNDPTNPLHKQMWDFAKFSIETVDAYKNDRYFEKAHNILDRGLVSCGWWWSSAKRPALLSPLTWHPGEVEKGLTLLLESMQTLKTLPPEIKKEAEDNYTAVKNLLWSMHEKMQKL